LLRKNLAAKGISLLRKVCRERNAFAAQKLLALKGQWIQGARVFKQFAFQSQGRTGVVFYG